MEGRRRDLPHREAVGVVDGLLTGWCSDASTLLTRMEQRNVLHLILTHSLLPSIKLLLTAAIKRAEFLRESGDNADETVCNPLHVVHLCR